MLGLRQIEGVVIETTIFSIIATIIKVGSAIVARVNCIASSMVATTDVVLSFKSGALELLIPDHDLVQLGLRLLQTAELVDEILLHRLLQLI